MLHTIKTTLLILFTAVLSLLIGGMIVIHPKGLFELNQVNLGNNPNLVNEIRAPGGVLIALGIVLTISLFRLPLRHTALVSSGIIMLGYGIARILSIAVDGPPAFSLQVAMVAEITIGFASLWVAKEKN